MELSLRYHNVMMRITHCKHPEHDNYDDGPRFLIIGKNHSRSLFDRRSFCVRGFYMNTMQNTV